MSRSEAGDACGGAGELTDGDARATVDASPDSVPVGVRPQSFVPPATAGSRGRVSSVCRLEPAHRTCGSGCTSPMRGGEDDRHLPAPDSYSDFCATAAPRLVAFVRWHGAPMSVAVRCVHQALHSVHDGWVNVTDPYRVCRREATHRYCRVVADVEPATEILRTVHPVAGIVVAAENVEPRHPALGRLDRLPMRARQLLAWSAEGAGTDEIASTLQLDRAAVEGRLRWARRALGRLPSSTPTAVDEGDATTAGRRLADDYGALVDDLRISVDFDPLSPTPADARSSAPRSWPPRDVSWAVSMTGILRSLDPKARFALRSRRAFHALRASLTLHHATAATCDHVVRAVSVRDHVSLASAAGSIEEIDELVEQIARAAADHRAGWIDRSTRHLAAVELRRHLHLARDCARALVRDLDGRARHRHMVVATSQLHQARRAGLTLAWCCVRELTRSLGCPVPAIDASGGTDRREMELAFDDFTDADLHDVHITAGALDRIRWSTRTRWPPTWRIWIRRWSVEVEPGVYLIRVGGGHDRTGLLPDDGP